MTPSNKSNLNGAGAVRVEQQQQTNAQECSRSPIDDGDKDAIKLQKQLSLRDGVAIIVGVIIGSGIFVSPKGVLQSAGSVGSALAVWTLSGMLSMMGALCYAELGTMIPKSGGDYAYISEAFGPLAGFLYLWIAMFILVPTGNAITAITFAQYLLQPLWGSCSVPSEAVRLFAAATTCLLTLINCTNVKWVTRVQDIFTATKIFALAIIVMAGVWYTASGNVQHLRDPMKDTNWQPAYAALAFYSGLFSYSGWNYLNYVTEELQDPYRNLPRAICISMPLVTFVYVVTNVAYFAVLTKDEILSSNVVAMTFGDKMLGSFSFLMPFFVACSTFGSLNGAIFASSRLFFVGARAGHLPTAIALIDIKRLTPVPSLIFLCLITLVYVVVEDMYALINFVSFVEALFITLSVSGLLYMRWSRPELHRPIRFHIMLPVSFLLICLFLVTFPCFATPVVAGTGTVFILSGIPVYYVTIGWTTKPVWLRKAFHNFNMWCAKLFLCVPENNCDDKDKS